VKKWGARKITHCKKEDFPDRLYISVKPGDRFEGG